MPLRGGVLMMEDECGSVQEQATFTCAHCQRVFPLNQRPARIGIIGIDNFHEVACKCNHCGKPVCLSCSINCDPWIDQMDRAEEKARIVKEYG